MVSGADENWTSRGVYATICRLYRIEPPFYENRRLSQRDFKAIEAEFVSRVGPRELHRRQLQASKGLAPSGRHLQAHMVFDKIDDYIQARCVGMKYVAARSLRISPTAGQLGKRPSDSREPACMRGPASD